MTEGIKLMSVNRLPISLSNRHVAALIGIRNLRVRVESVVCFESVTDKNRAQVFALEKWLKKNHFPPLLFLSSVKTSQEEDPASLCDHLLKTWTWTDKDCDFVLRLEGLPLF
jgi:hypothetical protein